MKQALYRNYRPRSFKELVGQEHVTTTLQKALKAGRISHAYLFTGPRGVGKTSAARILAHAANDLPYDSESAHLDIIEIDAASNRRIDEIRDLREKVAIAPTSGKYKVYIIDEVHMLTREAFNALLKTLEEPPAHVIFILATTEAHKLPETIISRTQRFEFKPLPKSQMARHLSQIAKSEKIDITPGALELLAEFGGGSFRDSISYLDQLSAAGSKVSEDDVRQVLGLPPEQNISDIVKEVVAGNSASTISRLDELRENGVDAGAAASAIARQIRQLLIAGAARQNLTALLKNLIEVPASGRPYDYLEIALLEASTKGDHTADETKSLPKEDSKKHEKPAVKSQPAAISAQQVDEPAPAKVKTATVFDISLWPQVVDGVKLRAASLYTALRLADPQFSDKDLTLRFQFPLHQKKLDQANNKATITSIIEELTGQKISIVCVVDKTAFKPNTPKVETVPSRQDPIHSINNIFGAAEVMET